MKSLAIVGALAMVSCLISSPDAIAQSVKVTPSVGTNAAPLQRTPPPIKPIQSDQVSKQIRTVPSPGAASPQSPGSQNLSGVRYAPSGSVQPVRPRAVHRDVAGRVNIDGGVLVLPTVGYYG